MVTPVEKSIEIFCCYAPEDQLSYEQLNKHLSSLRKLYTLKIWDANQIEPGSIIEKVLTEHIRAADLFLLLISPDFVSSDFCLEILERVRSRQEEGRAWIIPLLLRPVSLMGDSYLQGLKMLPADGKPIHRKPDKDEAFKQAAEEIARVIENVYNARGQSSQSGSSGRRKTAPSVLRQSEKEEAPTERTSFSQVSAIPKESGFSRLSRYRKWIGILSFLLVLGVLGTIFAPFFSRVLSPASPVFPPVHPGAPSPSATHSVTSSPYYQADWTSGFDGWRGIDGPVSSQWSNSTDEGAMIIADGSVNNDWLLPPSHVSIPSNNYSVSAQMQRSGYSTSAGGKAFGILARQPEQGYDGYVCGLGLDENEQVHAFIARVNLSSGNYYIILDLIRSSSFLLDKGWHTYRVDVHGKNISFWMDNQSQPLVSTNNATDFAGGQVGLYASSTQLAVKNFAVLLPAT